jgi:hypothetical protein
MIRRVQGHSDELSALREPAICLMITGFGCVDFLG